VASFNTPRLITPPREEEEVYPYRRVWRSIAIEVTSLVALTIIFVGLQLVGVSIPEVFITSLNLTIVLLPLLLWLLFSYLPERSAPAPRASILSILIVTALAANAIGIPFIERVMLVDLWLPQASSVDRIIGYALAVGMVQEVIKYLIFRYMIWPDLLRIRLDSVAYGAASAIGYATVINVNYILQNDSLPDTVALRTLSTVSIHLVGSIIIAYGFSELWFSRSNLLTMPIALILAAGATGLVITMRAGLTNAALSTTVSVTRSFFALGFVIIFLYGALFAIGFLFNISEIRSERLGEIDEFL